MSYHSSEYLLDQNCSSRSQPNDLAQAADPWKHLQADLHYIIQIAMGWDDEYLHHFHIYGQDYGIGRLAAGIFATMRPR